jgi:ABC-type branched-subunit amino acid transport system substrate-binding protein
VLGIALVVTLVCALLTAGAVTVGSAGAVGSARGFDGSTITVAGFGIKAQLPTLETGARARFERFNDNGEIKGVKIKMTEFTDDGQDNATALSIARRLVAQTKVFAIVPNGSHNTPGAYLTQQHVPWFGGGFDNTYCSNTPSTKVWGFGPSGCIVPANPSFVSDLFHTMYSYVSGKMGKKDPTFLSLGQDTESGKNSSNIFAVAAQGAGFKTVAIQNNMPLQVSDYSPYAQQLMTADHGKPPDAVFCTANTQCLGLWPLIQAEGYKGYFFHGLYADALVKPFKGSYVNHPYPNFSQSNPGFDQIKTDLNAFQAGAGDKPDLGDVFGYTAADVFIAALKKAAANGKSNITPEAVQKAASTLKWQLPGFMKVEYPKATVMEFPACFSISQSDGTAWQPLALWTCSSKTYSPNLKLG